MRQLIAIEFVSLDGVVQAPGGPDEDRSGGFALGGWIRPYADPAQSAVIRQQMSLPFDLLLGRTTFEIWAPYWPQHPDVWPEVQTATKYVASNTLTSHAWQPSVFLNGDVAGRVAQLKRQPGPDLHVYGSANLLQTLFAHDLVDALWLRIHPITLGGGKRLFAGGAIPAAFRLAEHQVTSTGVVLVNYERAGALPSSDG
jgi:dihydrofolate reductase